MCSHYSFLYHLTLDVLCMNERVASSVTTQYACPHSGHAAGEQEEGESQPLSDEEVRSAIEGSLVFKSVEMLLSALEACGVDNARIELEGGQEVPVLDGSALGWALHIQQAGLRPAPVQGGKEVLQRKFVLMPSQSITVSAGWHGKYAVLHVRLWKEGRRCGIEQRADMARCQPSACCHIWKAISTGH